MATTKSPSSSRTYVAMCNSPDFTGYYFRKFVLPEKEEVYEAPSEYFENSIATASWYFLNRLNFVACLESCMTFEDYQKLHEQVPR
jgi:hypothetical protein